MAKNQTMVEKKLSVEELVKAQKSEELQKVLEERKARIEAAFQQKLAVKLQRIIDREAMRSEFDKKVGGLRAELFENKKTIKELRARNRQIREEIKAVKNS